MLENETVEETARRITKGETGISNVHLEQLHVFSGIDRDPRRRAIGVGFMGIMTTNQEVRPGPEQQQAMFCPLQSLPSLVFDHKEVYTFAYHRLIRDVESGKLVQYFLPKYFTLKQLQSIYEIILQRRFDKRNFRRTIEKNHTLKATSYKEKNVAHRPAVLYGFK